MSPWVFSRRIRIFEALDWVRFGWRKIVFLAMCNFKHGGGSRREWSPSMLLTPYYLPPIRFKSSITLQRQGRIKNNVGARVRGPPPKNLSRLFARVEKVRSLSIQTEGSVTPWAGRGIEGSRAGWHMRAALSAPFGFPSPMRYLTRGKKKAALWSVISCESCGLCGLSLKGAARCSNGHDVTAASWLLQQQVGCMRRIGRHIGGETARLGWRSEDWVTQGMKGGASQQLQGQG